jgi:protein-S-isoprenylcysteine O-methyltransferase Ste14
MQPNTDKYIEAAWIVFALVWLAGTFTTKRTVRSQPAERRFLYGIMVLLAGTMFTGNMRFGSLGQRFLPPSSAASYTGLVLTIAGVAFAIWARFYLGRNWSGKPTIKEGHTLIRSGPYAFVRHPIYTGVALAILGTGIAIGEVRGLIATLLALIAFKIKSRLEESFMTEQFGEQYTLYKHQVRALIPFVW